MKQILQIRICSCHSLGHQLSYVNFGWDIWANIWSSQIRHHAKIKEMVLTKTSKKGSFRETGDKCSCITKMPTILWVMAYEAVSQELPKCFRQLRRKGNHFPITIASEELNSLSVLSPVNDRNSFILCQKVYAFREKGGMTLAYPLQTWPILSTFLRFFSLMLSLFCYVKLNRMCVIGRYQKLIT